MYGKPITKEDFEKFIHTPHMGLIITMLIIGFILLFMNNIIHSGSRTIESMYRFFLYSALFAYIYGKLLTYNILQKDFILIGVFFIGFFIIFSHRQKYSVHKLEGYFFLQNKIVKAELVRGKYSEIEGLSKDYTILSNYFIKDNKSVYYLSSKIEGLNPRTCKVVQFNNQPTPYIKDDQNVYYHKDVFDNSDPSTFKVIKYENSNFTARDKNYTYFERQQLIIDDNGEILEEVKSKKDIEEDKVQKEQLIKEQKYKTKLQNKIVKSDIKDNKGLIDYITDIPFKKVNINEASGEIDELLKTGGFFSLSLDQRPDKLYRLYQIYLNNDDTKAFDYLNRASISISKKYTPENEYYLAKYDYAYRVLTGNGFEQNTEKAIASLIEIKEFVELVASYDQLSTTERAKKNDLDKPIEFEPEVIVTKPITPMDIYFESCYLLAKIYAQGKLVSRDLILAEKYARPFTEIFYYNQKWSMQKKIRYRRYFLLYINIVQDTNYKGEDYSNSLFDMLDKMNFPITQ